MPYYLKEDDRKLLKKLRETCTCAECGGKLISYWGMIRKLPYLECKDHPEHEGIAREHQEKRELNIPTKIKEGKYGSKD